MLDAPILTADHDFFGTGLATWTFDALLADLDAEGGIRRGAVTGSASSVPAAASWTGAGVQTEPRHTWRVPSPSSVVLVMMRVEALMPVETGDTATLPFEDVYARHADAVYRFCVSLLHDRVDAEDVAASTFTTAYAAYGRVRPPADELRPWLFRIARNACIDQVRRRERARRLLGAIRLGRPAREGVEETALLHGELRRVVEAMAALTSRDRELVGLRVAGGLPFVEIGAVVGISEQAAKTATRRAIARLVERLGQTP